MATREIILPMGKPAPFKGVLLPEGRYRDLVSRSLELDSVSDDLDMAIIQLKGQELRDAEAKQDEPNTTAWFLGGFILGAFAGFYSASVR